MELANPLPKNCIFWSELEEEEEEEEEKEELSVLSLIVGSDCNIHNKSTLLN